MSTEKERWAKLAGLPESTDKQQLDENFVGMGMVGNIFDREKEKYEDAFEHFLSERYEGKVEESNTTNLDKKIQSDPEFLEKLKAAAEKAENGNSTELATLMAINLEEESLSEMRGDYSKHIEIIKANNMDINDAEAYLKKQEELNQLTIDTILEKIFPEEYLEEGEIEENANPFSYERNIVHKVIDDVATNHSGESISTRDYINYIISALEELKITDF